MVRWKRKVSAGSDDELGKDDSSCIKKLQDWELQTFVVLSALS